MPGPDGRFVLSALPPGRYTLMGRAAENGGGEGDPMPYFAAEFVLTDQNISGVVLQFERGVTVTGGLFRRRVPSPVVANVANVRLGATPVDSYASLVPAKVIATTRGDGTFVFDGMGPGKWRVTGASLPAGWSLRSAVLGGRDTLDLPFEVRLGQPIAGLTVTMTDQPTEVTGIVLDASGRPTSEYSMLAFSAERAHWTIAPQRRRAPVVGRPLSHQRLPPQSTWPATSRRATIRRSSDGRRWARANGMRKIRPNCFSSRAQHSQDYRRMIALGGPRRQRRSFSLEAGPTCSAASFGFARFGS